MTVKARTEKYRPGVREAVSCQTHQGVSWGPGEGLPDHSAWFGLRKRELTKGIRAASTMGGGRGGVAGGGGTLGSKSLIWRERCTLSRPCLKGFLAGIVTWLFLV